MYNTALNTNTIPHLWKRATIILIPQSNKYHNIGTHITSITHCQNTKENTLPYIIENIPAISHQNGFKHKHSTHTALQNISHQITKGFNNPRPPQRNVAVALDMSKAFNTVNTHKLIHKLTLTNIPKIIIKFIANYIKGRQACNQYNGKLSKLKRINTVVPQGGVLSPTLFKIYTSDIPLPPKDVQITTYADDITITASHTKHRKAQQLIQPYFHKIYKWATINNLHINIDKTTTTLFTSDPAEYRITLSLKLNNQTLPTTKHQKNC